MKPVVITIGGAELTTWTAMTLQRSKEELTGQLEVTIFGGAMPSGPMVRSANTGAPVQVYIAGQMAFDGTIDARTGEGKKSDRTKHTGRTAPSAEKSAQSTSGQSSVNIGPDEYSIKLTARGKTKRLIDSSHQHPTTNMMQPKTKEVVEKLIEKFKVQLDWKAEDRKLDKVRFRDGARVVDELHRLSRENAYFMYESRDGKLVVTDGVGGSGGDPLILGQNILTFSAEQSEDEAKSEIKAKGQRSKKNIRGKKAIKDTHKKVTVKGGAKDFAPLTVQYNGDATPEALERRARYEANKRNTESKKITIEVFHVQTPSGQPWDIGNTHYVEVPPEGIYDMFECTELSYHCNAEKELKTTLTLSPPPGDGAGGAGAGGGGSGGDGMGGFGLSSIPTTIGNSRRSQAGITITAGQYPDPWVSPQMTEMPLLTMVEEIALAATQEPEEEPKTKPPPLVLPPWFGEDT